MMISTAAPTQPKAHQPGQHPASLIWGSSSYLLHSMSFTFLYSSHLIIADPQFESTNH
jgi:hypothetical protein